MRTSRRPTIAPSVPRTPRLRTWRSRPSGCLKRADAPSAWRAGATRRVPIASARPSTIPCADRPARGAGRTRARRRRARLRRPARGDPWLARARRGPRRRRALSEPRLERALETRRVVFGEQVAGHADAAILERDCPAGAIAHHDGRGELGVKSASIRAARRRPAVVLGVEVPGAGGKRRRGDASTRGA